MVEPSLRSVCTKRKLRDFGPRGSHLIGDNVAINNVEGRSDICASSSAERQRACRRYLAMIGSCAGTRASPDARFRLLLPPAPVLATHLYRSIGVWESAELNRTCECPVLRSREFGQLLPRFQPIQKVVSATLFRTRGSGRTVDCSLQSPRDSRAPSNAVHEVYRKCGNTPRPEIADDLRSPYEPPVSGPIPYRCSPAVRERSIYQITVSPAVIAFLSLFDFVQTDKTLYVQLHPWRHRGQPGYQTDGNDYCAQISMTSIQSIVPPEMLTSRYC